MVFILEIVVRYVLPIGGGLLILLALLLVLITLKMSD